MPENQIKKGNKRIVESEHQKIETNHFRGKASGDQGVFLEPIGTQADNPFSPPQQSTTQINQSDTPVTDSSGNDSVQTE